MEVNEGGENGGGKKLCFGLWAYDVVYRWYFTELYMWNLYGFANQCHSKELNLKKKKKFIRVYFRQTNVIYGSKISNAPENDSFAVLFVHLELKREHMEDSRKVEESKVGKSLWLDYRIVNKVMLLNGLKKQPFEVMLTETHRNNWWGFLRQQSAFY